MKKREIILKLLAKGPGYGLDLVERSKGRLKRGTVYVELGRLAESGQVTWWYEPAEKGQRGPPRRMYALA